jgi:multiple sugar transport system permease protein
MKTNKRTSLIIFLALILGLVIVCWPFIFMLMNSFKPGSEIINSPNSLPTKLTLDGYIGVFRDLNLARMFLNSIFISGSVTILNMLFSAMVAYGLVKTKLPFKDRILDIILASMMVPGILLMIPSYCMFYNWGWINTYRVLIIPGCLSTFNIYLMVQFMRQLDNSYLEAARIDGANEWQTFFKVALPMCKPVLVTLGILTFMGSWNDFMGPLLYLRGDEKMTVQLAVYKYSTSIPGQYIEQLWAALTLVTLPVVIVYLFMQKSFIQAFGGVGLK